AEGRSVTIPGLGRFTVRNSPPRPGRNPKTGDFAAVPGRRKACFSMSRVFRTRMLRNFPAPAEETPRVPPEDPSPGPRGKASAGAGSASVPGDSGGIPAAGPEAEDGRGS
ncbi:MAG: HU family DNA-binding protein, partial [Deltaproteobacteria bacterium]|nr:HU family DNA-binding protein [Deltaproteobacteria bacterium]